ncbi:MAG TPA: SAM-dependent methyltransferase [Sphingomicrobium sp.]|nr:SAM-dependent methyltransferase [Sphingomicrobium sp.]
MAKALFDMRQRAIRRDRACRQGSALFLYNRIFDDTLERIALVNRKFQSAFLLGCPDRIWPMRLRGEVGQVAVADPGTLFAKLADGSKLAEDSDRLGDAEFDLCVAIGTLDTVNNLPLALANIRAALVSDGLLIGAISGGNTLPMLRAAMRAADAAIGAATPHVHPRIDAPSLCGLLHNAGFVNAVVDVDRIHVGYQSLQSEVDDLRAMAATNILSERSRVPITRRALAAAAQEYARQRTAERTLETFEVLHFAAWTPVD